MPRPPVKKTMKLAEAERLGFLKAELKWHKKKPLEESLREHIGKMIDNVDGLDVLAIGSGTLLIHQFILKDPDILRRVSNAFSTLSYAISDPFMVWIQGITSYFGLGWLWGPPPGYIETGSATGSVELDQLMLWILSFVIAFMLVKYGGQIFGMLGSSIGGIAGLIGLFV